MRAGYVATRKQDRVEADQIMSGGRQTVLGKFQDVHEEHATQQYTIGTRLVIDDRVFRYCQAKEALDPLLGGRADVMPREGEGDAVAYEAGDFVMTIPMNDNGPDYVAEQVADYWAEGYVWIQTSPMQMYRIKSSAVATEVGRVTSLTGGFVNLTLYEALKTRMTASMWITAWVNPYKVCKHEHSGKMSVICQPLLSVTVNYFFWGQTWGPCFGQLNGSAIGRTSNDRSVYYTSDGSLQAGVTQVETAGSAHKQRAGFVITNTEAWTNAGDGAESGGDQFYMLQLSP
jgi:hypothetical protein